MRFDSEKLLARFRGWSLLLDAGHPLHQCPVSIRDRRNSLHYIGWLNHQNFGDTILALVFKRWFSEYLVWQSYPREVLEARVDVALRPRRFHAAALGGGTLIGGPYLNALQRQTSADRPYFTFGTGCLDNRISERERNGWVGHLQATPWLLVRGRRSAKLCQERFHADHAVAIGDPALATSAIFPKGSLVNEDGLVGFNLGSHRYERHDKHFKVGVSILRHLKQLGYRFAQVSMHPIDDRETSAAFSEAGAVPEFVIAPHRTWSDASLIARLSLMICERLHAAVLAHAYDVPAIGFKYDEKLADHFDMMNQSDYLLDVHSSSFQLDLDCIEMKVRDAQRQVELISDRRSSLMKLQSAYLGHVGTWLSEQA